MKILESAENYLEAILIISKKQTTVRAADICNFFGYSRPTVSAVIKQFKENGYINVNDNLITLTEKGLSIAKTMFERHNVIAEILTAIGVDEETAHKDSCRIEHDISEKTFKCIKAYYNKNIDNLNKHS